MNVTRAAAERPLTTLDELRLSRRHWLSPVEVAHYVGCCLDTVYRAIHSGRLKAKRMGRRWKIQRDWVDDGFLQTGSMPSSAASSALTAEQHGLSDACGAKEP